MSSEEIECPERGSPASRDIEPGYQATETINCFYCDYHSFRVLSGDDNDADDGED